jgi:hypothetical protein
MMKLYKDLATLSPKRELYSGVFFLLINYILSFSGNL